MNDQTTNPLFDRPQEGKTYALTGGPGAPCIANGSTWAEAEVKPATPELDQLLAERRREASTSCVYPGCDSTRRTRGLCHAHYQAMRSRARCGIKAGRFTEAQYEADLEARGLLLPKGTGGHKPSCGYDLLDFQG